MKRSTEAGGPTPASVLFRLRVVLALLALTACQDAGPGPVADPVEGYRAPEATRQDGVRRILNHGPARRLRVYGDPPDREVRLLFLDGGPALPLPDRRVAWPDARDGRVVLFDRRGLVDQVLQGAPRGGLPLSRPFYAVATAHGIGAVESDGSTLFFHNGEPQFWSEPTLPAPVMAQGPSFVAATRTIREVSLGPVRPDEPLIWLSRPDGTQVRGIGRVEGPREPFLGPLVNAGWVAVSGEGRIYWAAALEPLLRRYDPDGTLLWESRWTPPYSVEPPKLIARDGQLTPTFATVQHGLVAGPDETVYVLAASRAGGAADRLLVFDEEGTLVEEAAVQVGHALFVDSDGRVYAVPPERAVARTGEAPRTAFPSFELPRLEDRDRVALEEFRGRVVVLNFWASWCAPCRREMPLLDALARELDSRGLVVLGLNEDVAPGQAVEFLEEIGGVGYPLLEGRGRLRDRYGYRGLPYTVVLDRELKVVRTFYGFGNSIEPIEDAVRRELARDDT